MALPGISPRPSSPVAAEGAGAEEDQIVPVSAKCLRVQHDAFPGRGGIGVVKEADGKRGDMSPGIRPIVSGVRLAGIAYTARTFPSDTTAVIRTLDAAPAGSVLVIDAGGTERTTVWGGTTSLVSRRRGLAGCVTNGSVRDVDELVSTGVPVYAAGIAPRGTVKHHEGWRGIPVSVGGVTVAPGDIVIGDCDGVVVVPAAEGAELCEPCAEAACARGGAGHAGSER